MVPPPYLSETSKCRARLLTFCQGTGLDLGCGTVEKIRPEAIGIDLRPGIADIVASVERLPIRARSQDYVFSSHALEHFPFPVLVLREWMRVLRRGGHLVLYLPHKDHYRQYNGLHFFNPVPVVVRSMIVEAALGMPVVFVHEHLDIRDGCYSFDLVAQVGVQMC